MLLVCFDLPRSTKQERRQATRYQKRLIDLGFHMKQFSLYERHVKKIATKDLVVQTLRNELPDRGMITLYVLPDEINNKQITILGKRAVQKAINLPRLIVI